MAGGTLKRDPSELRERAIRVLGIGTAEAVRKWVRQGEVDAGQGLGPTSDESAELKALGHRQAVTVLQPSLPQWAGRARKALQREVAAVERYRRESIQLGWKLDR